MTLIHSLCRCIAQVGVADQVGMTEHVERTADMHGAVDLVVQAV